jgi:lysyl-tRNA synthetase class II
MFLSSPGFNTLEYYFAESHAKQYMKYTLKAFSVKCEQEQIIRHSNACANLI